MSVPAAASLMRRLLRGAPWLFLLLNPVSAAAATAPAYVGSAACGACHAAEARVWMSSHHAQAMQPASPATVPGNFGDVTVAAAGGAVRLFKRDGQYFANAQGPDGRRQDFQVRYTFGVYPLQQYLVELPGGRLQVLDATWDSRPKSAGGQRWYSLHAGEQLAPGDPLHWTGRDQNWNFMCAGCHATDLRRNYAAASGSYHTTWSEIGVGCEACHGPGSAHLAWAHNPDHAGKDTGLTVSLQASRRVQWGFWQAGQRIASPRTSTAPATAQAGSCFPCHARRQALTDGTAPGSALLDGYLPQLIEPGVYHADGQIEAEDFEYGSFIQSRMYARGVTCTNCHDAHSLKLRAPGNAVCTQCHRADVYDTGAHHHHRAQTDGARCTSCHMPEQTYMGVDRRRDHSFRIPRPELAATGSPNACNQCHANKTSAWASAAIAQWTGRPGDPSAHFASAFDAAWSGAPATAQLLKVLSQPLPGMVRATALSLLPTQAEPGAAVQAALAAGVRDADPLVRLGAARGIGALDAATALRTGAALLTDPMKAVRIEAARSLAGSADASTPPQVVQRLGKAVDELLAAERAASERPESHVNLAQIQSRLGNDGDAERELQAALRLDPRFVPAMVNLADLYRARSRDADAEHWLRRAVSIAPAAAEPAHALGLLEVRQGHRAEALVWLQKAAQLDPANARYVYVYAIGLSEAGRRSDALAVLQAARRRLPKDQTLLGLQQQLQGQ